MQRIFTLALILPVMMSAVLFTGCEDDDSPSGTATVTGYVRQFKSPQPLAVTTQSKAVADVTIELRTTDGSYTAMTTSGADGTFTFENVPAGDFELILTGGGLTGRLTFAVKEGETVTLVDIIVERDGTTREGKIEKKEPEPQPEPQPMSNTSPPTTKLQWIDQQQTAGTASGQSVHSGYALSQEVKAGSTNGFLVKIELSLSLDASPDKPLKVDIGSAVGGADIASATLQPTDISGTFLWHTVTFPARPAITAGSTFYITLTSTSNIGTHGGYKWEYSPAWGADEYPAGDLFFSQFWLAWNKAYDANFKVWLEE